MATYKEIQEYTKEKFGFVVKTCWIAHVKEMHSLNLRIASNRKSSKRRIYPCPKDKVSQIKEAFIFFKMI